MNWREAPAADFAVIGDPVSHSLSPVMHQAAYSALGLAYRYLAIHVPSSEVGQALDRLESLGYCGVNVTVPHKEEVLSFGGLVEPFATRVRAANTIRLGNDRAATNSDAPGFLDTLADLPSNPRRVLILGAGGSARAIVASLADAGYELQIYNRTQSRAEALLADLGISAEVLAAPDIREADLIVNTTSASLQGDRLAIDWSSAKADAVAYDLMYKRGGTIFQNEAAAAGLRTVDGLPLLVAQGARSIEWWLGVTAPREAMLEAVRCAS